MPQPPATLLPPLGMTAGGLHRRTSSAALHYSSLPGNEGLDISQVYGSTSSSAASKASSSSHHAVSVSREDEQEEMEEKVTLLADDSLPGPPRKKQKKQRSKCRALFYFMVLASLAIILYALVTGWVEKRDVEKAWGDWKTWTTKQQENWAGSGKGSSEVDNDNTNNTTDATSIEALLAAKARPKASASSSSSSADAPVPTTSRTSASTSKVLSSANNATYGTFSATRTKELDRLVDNGNFSLYKWHETLPSLSLSSYSSSKDDQARRLIVVGDLHGTHRSLFHLLRKLAYTPSHDTLVHTGDILSKSTLENSLATVKMLRRLGAKGVRGNHDQKVIEWRKWMEELGPLNVTATSDAIDRGNSRKEALQYDDSEERVKAMSPRKEKRGWSDWLPTSTDADVDAEEDIETGDEDEVAETGDRYEEGDLPLSSSSTTTTTTSSAATSTGARRRPFGQRPARLSASSSATTSSSTAARPARPTSKSSLSTATNTTLLGALYSHLDPSLTPAQRARFGINRIPVGWEWGGQHFEIARHLSREDFEYLTSLPLTLWVEELNSLVVHAGLVPWSETPTASFSPLSESAASSLVSSTSLASFVPPTTSHRSLLSTLRGSLLLASQNTEPFTLLNLRTLSRVHSSSSSYGKVKGPADEWTVSSKSRKAGKNSQPWWSVWEDRVGEYERETSGEDEDVEAVGVIYGHWASQGLQLQPHSLGLDSGCVYGRQLSALVVDLSSSSNSTISPLATASGSSSPSSASSATSAVNSSSSRLSRPSSATAQAGGRFDRIVKVASSSTAASAATASATSTGLAEPTAFDDDLDAQGAENGTTKPWWKPWKRSTDGEDSEGDEEASYQAELGDDERPLEKRAPPQFRPMGGLDQERILSAAAVDADDDDDEVDEATSTRDKTRATATLSVSSSSSSTDSIEPTPTDHRRKPFQFGKKFTSSLTPPSSASSTSSVSASSSSSSSSSAAVSVAPSTATGSKSDKFASSFKSALAATTSDDEDDEAELSPLAAKGEDSEEDSEDEDSLFTARQTVYKPLGDAKKVWIVSVDCRGEVEMDTE
ncbi:hypothetical protein JCM11491_000453 [Sporobolomyces phaffii]